MAADGNAVMTMPYERTRAVIQTRAFLQELSINLELPEKIRKQALWCLRHYPTAFQVHLAAHQEMAGEKPLLGPVFWPAETYEIPDDAP
jgi:hypothetical protein